MTSEEANEAEAALFDAADYTIWCRRLYENVPRDGSAHILFDSTISEPTELLRQTIIDAFGAGVSDRFVSVFGQGNGYLTDAIASRYGVDADQVVCASSASNAITMALRSLPPEKRRVAIETPRLDLLHHVAGAGGFQISEIQREGEAFDIDPDALHRILAPDVGMVILTNPHNPSGAVLPVGRLSELAAIAQRVGAMILVDEVYSDLLPADGFTPAVNIAPNMISVNSLSKSFGLFSLRCGWLLADAKLARRIGGANLRVEFGTSKLTHAIAAHVLENVAPFETHWRSVLAANRPVLERHVSSMKRDGLIAGEIPSAGCMYFPRILDVADTRALARALWEDHRVLTAPGEYFDCPGHLRLGFGVADSRLDAGLGRLHEALRLARKSNPADTDPRSAYAERLKVPR